MSNAVRFIIAGLALLVEVLEEGSYEKSLNLLESRQRNACCRQMVESIQKQIGTTY